MYTAIVGGYDDILQPEVIDNRFDYILFSNDIKEPKVGVWQVRPINYHNNIQTKIARWVKTHPEELLPEYECSVWMDANIVIHKNIVYSRIIELYDKKVLIASMPHFDRHCIYDEMYTVIKLKLETEDNIIRWGRFLKKNKYPRNNGLHETGVLYRIHSNYIITQFDKLWWQCIDNYSRRDQLSFDFVLWKLKIPCKYILSEVENVWNSNSICIENATHKNATNRVVDKKNTLLWSYCTHYSDIIIKKAYYFVYSSPFPKVTAKIIGLCFRFRDKLKSCLNH